MQEVFYVFNGFDDFPTTLNMWLSLPSMFTHSSTVDTSLAGITTNNRTGNNNHTSSTCQIQQDKANKLMRNTAVRDAQKSMPLILFFNTHSFLNHENNTVGRVMVDSIHYFSTSMALHQ
jgi:hypothetical protein